MKIKTIRLGNSVKCGSREDYLFNEQQAKAEFFAVKMPVVNGTPGESAYQPVVKLTDKKSGRVVYTSLMNTIYWEMDDTQPTEDKKDRVDTTKDLLRKMKERAE